VGEVGFHEGDRQIAEPFRHCTESYPWSRILCKNDYRRDNPILPSGKPFSSEAAHV
jgi:hypothetical protein